VQDNIAAVPLQVDEFAGRLFNEPVTPVRSDSVGAAELGFAAAVALKASVIGITINDEYVAGAIGVKPIDCDCH
jgi:hypothetical protein